LPEVVTHGTDGFLLPVGDIDGMAQAALSLLTDPNRHSTMAGAARQTAQERFNTEQVIPQYESYYEEVCARARDAAPEDRRDPNRPKPSSGGA
jgi:glycosyltransferase involved in cell wall biosynthesis